MAQPTSSSKVGGEDQSSAAADVPPAGRSWSSIVSGGNSASGNAASPGPSASSAIGGTVDGEASSRAGTSVRGAGVSAGGGHVAPSNFSPLSAPLATAAGSSSTSLNVSSTTQDGSADVPTFPPAIGSTSSTIASAKRPSLSAAGRSHTTDATPSVSGAPIGSTTSAASAAGLHHPFSQMNPIEKLTRATAEMAVHRSDQGSTSSGGAYLGGGGSVGDEGEAERNSSRRRSHHHPSNEKTPPWFSQQQQNPQQQQRRSASQTRSPPSSSSASRQSPSWRQQALPAPVSASQSPSQSMKQQHQLQFAASPLQIPQSNALPHPSLAVHPDNHSHAPAAGTAYAYHPSFHHNSTSPSMYVDPLSPGVIAGALYPGPGPGGISPPGAGGAGMNSQGSSGQSSLQSSVPQSPYFGHQFPHPHYAGHGGAGGFTPMSSLVSRQHQGGSQTPLSFGSHQRGPSDGLFAQAYYPTLPLPLPLSASASGSSSPQHNTQTARFYPGVLYGSPPYPYLGSVDGGEAGAAGRVVGDSAPGTEYGFNGAASPSDQRAQAQAFQQGFAFGQSFPPPHGASAYGGGAQSMVGGMISPEYLSPRLGGAAPASMTPMLMPGAPPALGAGMITPPYSPQQYHPHPAYMDGNAGYGGGYGRGGGGGHRGYSSGRGERGGGRGGRSQRHSRNASSASNSMQYGGSNNYPPMSTVHGYNGTAPSASSHPTPGYAFTPSTSGQAQPLRSALLEEFRARTRSDWTIAELRGHLHEFSTDQHGSRFIQERLDMRGDVASSERDLIFDELIDNAKSLVEDAFGNYVSSLSELE